MLFRLPNELIGFQLMIVSFIKLAMLGLGLFLEKMENDSALAVLKQSKLVEDEAKSRCKTALTERG